ncbi:hypothetical protein J4050_10905 [Winogradskyella sp. DF17]|uniref:Uncharacterized protein n=1 Tax=Winogradskyella pelagia TaxID=2819984 RepID=A0ABS3T3E2_9FLAO|nr:hypothetical protein [Winogradskyella sp. DF17]MBO3117260.1 hypothetical protein [Winogradskyella sp. DF17]
MKKIHLVILFCLMFVFAFAQKKSINNYKYIIVPIQFDFSKGKDTWRINTLTKYLFKEEGFEVYFDEQELPKDLFKDRCLALYANVEDVKGGFLKTRVQISLKDCYGEIVMLSKIGESKKKKYKEAYEEGIREAFESIRDLNYTYSPKAKEELKVEDNVAVSAIAADVSETFKATDSKASPEIRIEETTNEVKGKNEKSSFLKLKPITLGYEVLNDKGEVTMVLLATSSRDIFIVKDKSAIIYKNADGNFMYSENDGTSIVQKPISIRF